MKPWRLSSVRSGTIGRAIATAFAAEGARIAAVDIHFSEIARWVTANFIADVTDYAAICQVILEIRTRLGRIDHVVFAAAVGSGKYGFPFWNLEPADWDRVLRVNLVGAVNVAHAAAPHLVEQKRGTCSSSDRSPVKSARRPIHPTAPPRLV